MYSWTPQLTVVGLSAIYQLIVGWLLGNIYFVCWETTTKNPFLGPGLRGILFRPFLGKLENTLQRRFTSQNFFKKRYETVGTIVIRINKMQISCGLFCSLAPLSGKFHFISTSPYWWDKSKFLSYEKKINLPAWWPLPLLRSNLISQNPFRKKPTFP